MGTSDEVSRIRTHIPGKYKGGSGANRIAGNPVESAVAMIYGIKQLFKYMLGRDIAGRTLAVRPDDVFLVSYPRSGNTWTRFLVANLLHPHEPATFANIERMVPDIYVNSQVALLRVPHPRVLKSHEPFDPRYKKVVYIVRDPRDVAVSMYHWEIKRGRIREECPWD